MRTRNTGGKTTVNQNTASLLTLATPSRTIYNISAAYETQIGGYETAFRAGIQNAADKAYWAGGASNLFVGAPRVFAINASVTF